MAFHSFQRVAAVALALLSFAVLAAPDPATIPEIKRTKLGLYMTAAEAHSARTAGEGKVMLIDVRTRAEAAYVGMATTADALVPYMEHSELMNEWDDKRQTYDVFNNANFLPELERRLKEKGLGKDTTLILMCRSGDRSSKAADALAHAGYTRVFSVVDGFEGDAAKDGPKVGQRVVNGWKNAGLPWSYRLDKQKAYLPK